MTISINKVDRRKDNVYLKSERKFRKVSRKKVELF